MLFQDYPVIIRGGGDLATGVAYRLHKAGFPLIILELPRPLVVRRRVALATAVLEREVTIETLHGRLAESVAEAEETAYRGKVIPVLVAPELAPTIEQLSTPPTVVVDARMAKRNIDTSKDHAPLVIALGPGFTAGVDCHAVIETMRGHHLGRVIWDGPPLPDTGAPGRVAGKTRERVLRAPAAGPVQWKLEIGDTVTEDQVIGAVDGNPITAPFDGVIRGLIAPDTNVREGMKIGDVDARGDASACYTISDKSLAIGGGVLEAVLTWLNECHPAPPPGG